jgi:hypothetical protein
LDKAKAAARSCIVDHGSWLVRRFVCLVSSTTTEYSMPRRLCVSVPSPNSLLRMHLISAEAPPAVMRLGLHNDKQPSGQPFSLSLSLKIVLPFVSLSISLSLASLTPDHDCLYVFSMHTRLGHTRLFPKGPLTVLGAPSRDDPLGIAASFRPALAPAPLTTSGPRFQTACLVCAGCKKKKPVAGNKTRMRDHAVVSWLTLASSLDPDAAKRE